MINRNQRSMIQLKSAIVPYQISLINDNDLFSNKVNIAFLKNLHNLFVEYMGHLDSSFEVTFLSLLGETVDVFFRNDCFKTASVSICFWYKNVPKSHER